MFVIIIIFFLLKNDRLTTNINNAFIICYISDGVVRVFSADPGRQADEETQAQFAKDVAAFSQTTEQEIGGVKVSE